MEKPWVCYRQGLDCPGKVIAQMVVTVGYFDDDPWYVDGKGRKIACDELIDLASDPAWDEPLVLRLFNSPYPGRVKVDRVSNVWVLWYFDGNRCDPPDAALDLLQRHVNGAAWLSIELAEKYCRIAANRLRQNVLAFGESDD